MTSQNPLSKTKFFSLRLTQELRDRVEQVKTAWGGQISSSEVVRQLIERGFDQLNYHDLGGLQTLQERPRETLLRILSKRRDQLPLTQAEWAFLAHSAHDAYQAVSNPNNRIERGLLADNFRALQAVVGVQNQPGSKSHGGCRDSDNQRHLGIYGNDLEASVEEAISSLPVFPSPFMAQTGSRDLYRALGTQPVEITALHTHLAPYFESLLVVALRGYWMVHHRSVLGDVGRSPVDSVLSYQRLCECRSGEVALSAEGFDRQLRVRLSLYGGSCALELSHYVEVTEFVNSVRVAVQSGEDTGGVNGEPFRMSWQPGPADRRRTYRLHHPHALLSISYPQMKALSDVLIEAMSTPNLQIHMGKLAFVYGKI